MAPDARIEWAKRAPTPRLRPFVESYRGYRLAGFAPGIHRGMPSGHMTFIVSIGQEIDVVSQTDPAQGPRQYAAVLGGLHASPALIAHDGNQEGVTIELTPLGSRSLLGMPARELHNLTVELADVVGGAGNELWERLHTTTDWRARFAACDDVLSRIAREHTVIPELQHAWTALRSSAGQLPVSWIASATGWSRQHLARRFRDEFGVGPKLAARLIRFERARRMIQTSPPFVSLAQVAATCGYYDQAHLNRDFAELAGCTPTQLLAEDLPDFQDPTAADESVSNHGYQPSISMAGSQLR